MKKIIRLTESQLHNLIVEALLESARESDWRFPYKEAKKLLYQSQNMDENSEEYAAMWDKYCDLIRDAQERFMAEHHAKHDYDANLQSSVQDWIDKGLTIPADCHDENLKFLFHPLVYLTPYDEMGNQDPNIKYMNKVQIGCINAIVNHESRQVRSIDPVESDKNKEWDLSNYVLLDSKRPNMSHKRKNFGRTEKTPKNCGGIQIDDMRSHRAYVKKGETEDDDEWMDHNSEGYDENMAKPYWVGEFGKDFWKRQDSTHPTKADINNNYGKYGKKRVKGK